MARRPHVFIAALAVVAVLAGCGNEAAPPATETVAPQAVLLSVSGEGELKSSKSTTLQVPGSTDGPMTLTHQVHVDNTP